MKYISTRGKTESRTFIQAVLEGLARDGGLFIPESIPDVSTQLKKLSMLSYQELAVEIFSLFTTNEIPRDKLSELVYKSYASFLTKEITPLVYLKKLAVLELYHGPTLAFKDIALQFLGNLFEELLKTDDTCLNILGATSGDTGSAAIHGVRGKNNINIFMLHPKGKISPIQEKQMTTVLDDNVHNIAVEGTFDDAQKIVKEVFNDLDFRDKFHLGAVNSINWARVMAQIVYYFYSAFRYMEHNRVSEVVFSVPTGNFGDIYAGYLAKKMGLPISKLILATNENDILYRVIKTGSYKISQVTSTLSPSMDIQIASNFERFVFDISGKNGSLINEKMDNLSKGNEFVLSSSELKEAQSCFIAIRIDTRQTLEVMKRYREEGFTIDPHTAVGVAAAEQSRCQNIIALATAHPAKFADAVTQATGVPPEVPELLQGILEKESHCLAAKNDSKEIKKIIMQKVTV